MENTMRKMKHSRIKRITALFLAVTMLVVTIGTISAEALPVTVKITEHSGTFVYDGAAKTVSGYDVLISDPLYTVNDFSFSFIGGDSVSGTEAGSYSMSLAPEHFVNNNQSFSLSLIHI